MPQGGIGLITEVNLICLTMAVKQIKTKSGKYPRGYTK